VREKNAIHIAPFLLLGLLRRMPYSTSQLCLLPTRNPVKRYASSHFASDRGAYMAMELFIILEGLIAPVAVASLGMMPVDMLSNSF